MAQPCVVDRIAAITSLVVCIIAPPLCLGITTAQETETELYSQSEETAGG
jgi:hypothetical protein